MSPALFYLFSTVMLVAGLLVVTLRNPVSGALSLVVAFLGLAALYITLDAFFLGVIQILVYAGAVMVLFLFIIMLLDLKEESRGRVNILAFAGGIALVIAFSIQLIGVLSAFGPGRTALDQAPIVHAEAARLRDEAGRSESIPARLRDEAGRSESITESLRAGSLPDVKLLGERLFTDYHFHLQVVAVLLLVATVGVVVFSKRELK